MKIYPVLPILIGAFGIGCGSNGGDQADNTGAPPPSKSPAPSTPDAAPAGGGKGYAAVQQIFTANCGCHGATNPKGGINLTSYEAVMKGGGEGPVIKAGDPEGSVLVQALSGTNHKKKMPPKGDLPAEQMKTITDWIKDGAKNS